jgi:hypothetical protein
MRTDDQLRKKTLLNVVYPLVWLSVFALIILSFAAFTNRASVGARGSTIPSLAHPEQAQSAFDFVNSMGVNTHLNYFDRTYGDFALVEKELCSIGIRHVRDGVHLQNTDYDKTLYSRWKALGKCRIRFDAVLDPRSNLGAITTGLLAHVDDLAGYTIESFEGANEMDVSGIPDWAVTTRNFQKTLHEAALSLPDIGHISILAPSLAFASHGNEFGGAMVEADKGNLHPYPAGKMPSAIFPEQTDLAREIFGGRQVVFTESGYHNALNDRRDQLPVSESAAAKYISRLFLEDFAQGIPRTYLYEFLDEAVDPGLSDNQLHWGLVRANGTEKPAFITTKRLIAEVSDSAEPARFLHLAWSIAPIPVSTHHLLLQKSDGEFDLIIWREISSFDLTALSDIDNAQVASVLTLGRRATRITLYEPFLQDEPIKIYSNTAHVPILIPDHPLVIAIALQ